MKIKGKLELNEAEIQQAIADYLFKRFGRIVFCHDVKLFYKPLPLDPTTADISAEIEYL